MSQPINPTTSLSYQHLELSGVKPNAPQKNGESSSRCKISKIEALPLPVTLVRAIAEICDRGGVGFLFPTPGLDFPSLIEHATGSPIQATLQKAFKKIDKICNRFEALRREHFQEGKSLPEDLLNLYKTVEKNRNYSLAKELETFLDNRDNLIFWKKMGVSNFDLDQVESYHEINEAYFAIDKQSANLEQKDFQLQGLRLTSIPSDLLSHFQIHKLDVGENLISEISESLGNHLRITELHLNHNHLTTLPESFGNLTLLQKLTLNDNRLSSLSTSFGNLAQLETLWLQNNRLPSLPDSFENLKHLRILTLNSNKLTHLPENFGNLANLENLTINKNQLERLPESFSRLVLLRQLGLNGNKLQALPKEFKNLIQLETLTLAQNSLPFLPMSIVSLKNLQRLLLTGNSLIILEDVRKKFPPLGKSLDAAEMKKNQLFREKQCRN